MATFLTNPLPASDAKIRFMEPYVSNGLNRRTVGIVPEGIYRGFNVSAIGTVVTVAADVVTMDSVAVCETLDEALVPNQFQLTVRHEGDFILDFSPLGPADYPNAIVMETVYDLTGTAPLTGVTTVTIKVLDLVDVLPEHVVLCQTTKVGPNVIIDNTNREDLGGPLVTQTQLAGAGGGTTLAFTDINYTGGTEGFGAIADVTGVTIAFNLSVDGAVQFFGSGASLANPFIQGNYLGLAVNVNGTDYMLNGTGAQGFNAVGGGNLVTFGFTGGNAISGQRALNLVAGPYTVKLRAFGNGYLNSSVDFPTRLTAVYPVLTGSAATASPITTQEAENVTGGSITNSGAIGTYADVPLTTIAFALSAPQTIYFSGEAYAFRDDAQLGRQNTQLGLSVDGVDYNGTAADTATLSEYVSTGVTVTKGISLPIGLHTAKLRIRRHQVGNSASAIVVGDATHPIRLTALYTIPQTAAASSQYTEVIDDTSGTFALAFGPAFPIFSPIPSPVGAFVQGGAIPSDVAVAVSATSLFGTAFHDGSVLGISLDAGPIRVVASTTNTGLGDGRGVVLSSTLKFPAVPPGAHTFNLHLSIGYGLLSASVLRTAVAPLRILISHQ